MLNRASNIEIHSIHVFRLRCVGSCCLVALDDNRHTKRTDRRVERAKK